LLSIKVREIPVDFPIPVPFPLFSGPLPPVRMSQSPLLISLRGHNSTSATWSDTARIQCRNPSACVLATARAAPCASHGRGSAPLGQIPPKIACRPLSSGPGEGDRIGAGQGRNDQSIAILDGS
jgi:hypothetical protein